MLVAPVSVQVPASQHVPPVHDEMPVHWTLHDVPPHCRGAGHALIPVQVMLFTAPCSTTPPGHAEAPAHVTAQSFAVQVTPVVHELDPQETVQLDPPQRTVPQLDAALQSTLHEVAEVQSTVALVPPATTTEQGTPAGHLHAPADPTPQVMVHFPPVHVPPWQTAAQLASPTVAASAGPSADASASPESPPSPGLPPPPSPGRVPSLRASRGLDVSVAPSSGRLPPSWL